MLKVEEKRIVCLLVQLTVLLPRDALRRFISLEAVLLIEGLSKQVLVALGLVSEGGFEFAYLVLVVLV